jgi:predicted metallopeptidase
VTDNPTVYFTPYAWAKLWAYVRNATAEIAGMGIVEVVDNDYLLVSDVFIVEQEASAAHADFDVDGVARFMEELIAAGREDDIPKMKLWWHSHGTLEAYFSSRDTQTIDEWKNTSYLVSIVCNKKNRYSARLDLWSPIRMTTDVDVEIFSVIPEEEIDSIKKEIAEKVKTPKTTSGKVYYTGYTGGTDYLVKSLYRKELKKKEKGHHHDEPDMTYDEYIEHLMSDKCCSDMGCCGRMDYWDRKFFGEGFDDIEVIGEDTEH